MDDIREQLKAATRAYIDVPTEQTLEAFRDLASPVVVLRLIEYIEMQTIMLAQRETWRKKLRITETMLVQAKTTIARLSRGAS